MFFAQHFSSLALFFGFHLDERYVEITYVVHGQHGFGDLKDELKEGGTTTVQSANTILANAMQPFSPKEFVCNYRFIRQFRSPSVDTTIGSYWTINKLNHFRPLHYILKGRFQKENSS